MTTPLVGLTDEQTRARRESYVRWLGELDDDQLRFVYANTIHLLRHRQEEPDKGTSELELRRIFFEDEFRKRSLEVPEIKPLENPK